VDEGSGLFAFEQTVDPLAEPVYTRIVAAPMASTFFSDPDPLTVDDAYTWIESRYAETPIDPEVCSMLFPMIDPEGKETVWARMGIGTPANDALTKFLEFLPAMSEVHQQIRQLAQIRANEGLDPDESLCLEIEAIHLEADSEQLYRGFLGLVDHAEEMRGETAP